MKKDSRLSGVLHILLHLAEVERPMTSDQLATAMKTHPVVVRRALANLRAKGFVASEKGHGGGWLLNCDLATVTLLDIHDALGAPDCIALAHRDESSTCLVEKTVNAALGDAFEAAERLLLARFAQVTLADLSADFNTRFAALKHAPQTTKTDLA